MIALDIAGGQIERSTSLDRHHRHADAPRARRRLPSATDATRPALLAHGGLTLTDACEAVTGGIDGEAGLVAVDRDGNVAMPFNTQMMHRGLRPAGLTDTAVFAS